MGLYARLARIEDQAGLETFEDELIDRFGDPPEPAQRLIALTRLRLMAKVCGIERIDAGPGAIAFTPRRGFAADAAGLVEKDGRLLLAERIEDPQDRLQRTEELLAGLLESR